MVAAIAVAVYAPQFIASTSFATSVATATGLSAATVGAISAGAISGAISTGNIQGAFTGGLTAGMFAGIHSAIPEWGLEKIAAHGMAGGFSSVLQGGDFKSGFLAAGVTQAFAPAIDNIDRGTLGPSLSRTVAAAAVGGASSVLGGGKFANGAVTGAFSRLFNDDFVKKAFDVQKAINHLNANAAETSQGKCATRVRESLEAGGLKLNRPASGDAKDYGSSLEAAGLKKIDAANYSPQIADVIVIQGTSRSPSGHMEMYNGEIMVSDFKQTKDIYPGPTYRKEKPSYEIYR